MEMGTANTELPTITIGKRVYDFSYSVPEVTMRIKVIAKLHVPEFYMSRERLPFNHKHCKTMWKVKHIGFGVKTKIPVVKCWETPAYTDVPKTRMVLREMKTDIPEVSMRDETIKLEVPTFTAGTTMVEMDVPVVKKVAFNVAGLAKDFIPGGSIIHEILEIIEKTEEFRKNLEEKITRVLGSVVNPILESLRDLEEDIVTAIDRVQDRYAAIVRELEDAAGEHSEEIRRQAEAEAEKVEELKKQLQPILDSMQKIEDAQNRALKLKCTAEKIILRINHLMCSEVGRLKTFQGSSVSLGIRTTLPSLKTNYGSGILMKRIGRYSELLLCFENGSIFRWPRAYTTCAKATF